MESKIGDSLKTSQQNAIIATGMTTERITFFLVCSLVSGSAFGLLLSQYSISPILINRLLFLPYYFILYPFGALFDVEGW